MTSNLYLGRADARAVLRIAREHDVDVLSLQELRPPLMRGSTRRARSSASRGGRWTRARARRAPACSRASPLRGGRHRADATATREPEVEIARPRRAAGADQGRPPAPRRSTAVAAPPGSARSPRSRAPTAAATCEILAGDFNATLDHPELRDLLDRGYTDAADAVGEGLVWTWPARRRSRALPLTIDHVLVDRGCAWSASTVVRVPGSDHRAVIAVLRLPKACSGVPARLSRPGREGPPPNAGLRGRRVQKPGVQHPFSSQRVCRCGGALSNRPGVERGPTRESTDRRAGDGRRLPPDA